MVSIRKRIALFRGAYQDGVINLRSKVFEAGANIASEHIEYVLHAQPVAPNARASPTLIGVKGDAV